MVKQLFMYSSLYLWILLTQYYYTKLKTKKTKKQKRRSHPRDTCGVSLESTLYMSWFDNLAIKLTILFLALVCRLFLVLFLLCLFLIWKDQATWIFILFYCLQKTFRKWIYTIYCVKLLLVVVVHLLSSRSFH